MRKILTLAVTSAVLASTAVSAVEQNSRVEENALEISQSVDTSILEKQEQLSQEERALAREWRLTDRDWIKYKELMSEGNPRAIWSPGLDPISALGVHETDPMERRRYADIWMEVETARVELELAFEVERMAAAKRLHGNTPMIDGTAIDREWRRKYMARTHEVAMFVDADCVETCKELYNEVSATTSEGRGARLDVYFPQGTSAEAIGRWAQGVGIDPQAVREQKVTLNFDDGKFLAFDVSVMDLPEVRTRSFKTGEVQKTFTRW